MEENTSIKEYTRFERIDDTQAIGVFKCPCCGRELKVSQQQLLVCEVEKQLGEERGLSRGYREVRYILEDTTGV